ncbi:HNH endonuclease [Elizabethkingia anophelis]|nr:HNH endonuclease [Elizabethkingia anophelis]MCT4106458.1 HNH endonuclease [Elizabethkingia anophelis]
METPKQQAIKSAYGSYQVYESGDVYNSKCKKLKPYLDKDGYMRLSLSIGGKVEKWLVHRLIAKLFIPNPKFKPEVNHIDGVKSNNCVKNLEWCDRSSNMIHFRDKMRKYKLNIESATEIFKSNLSLAELSEKYNISRQTICDIKAGRIWKDIKANNGWTRIESEGDMPKEYKNYWCRTYNGDTKILRFDPEFKEWYYECNTGLSFTVTHYQPIETPKPPIF